MSVRVPWVVGVSGASGTPYAAAVIRALLDAGEAVDLVVSRAARLTILDETGIGNYEDKILKKKGKARVIWNSLKGKKSRGVIGEDPENNLVFVAKPMAEAAGFKFWKPIIWDKCLGPDTPVWTARGVLPIEQIVVGDQVALPGGGTTRVRATRRPPAARCGSSSPTTRSPAVARSPARSTGWAP